MAIKKISEVQNLKLAYADAQKADHSRAAGIYPEVSAMLDALEGLAPAPTKEQLTALKNKLYHIAH